MKTADEVTAALVALHEIVSSDIDLALLEQAIAERETNKFTGNFQIKLELEILRTYRR